LGWGVGVGERGREKGLFFWWGLFYLKNNNKNVWGGGGGGRVGDSTNGKTEVISLKYQFPKCK